MEEMTVKDLMNFIKKKAIKESTVIRVKYPYYLECNPEHMDDDQDLVFTGSKCDAFGIEDDGNTLAIYAKD